MCLFTTAFEFSLEGSVAHGSGLARHANPYRWWSLEWMLWNAGWDENQACAKSATKLLPDNPGEEA